MGIINRTLNGLVDLVLRPFTGLSAWPALVVASLLTAAVLVALFGLSSDQEAIRRTRNRFLARTLELLLFQHDLRVSLTACGRIFAANGAYLWQFLKPMAIGLVPLVLIFVQLESWFDRRPLKVGEQAVLTVRLDPSHPVMTTPAEITVPASARIDSPPIRTPSRNEIAWRIVATESGSEWLNLKVGDTTERKSLVVSDRLARVSPRRESRGIVRELFAPSEPPLATDGAVTRMELSYPRREIDLGLTEIPWVISAVVLMMTFSLLLGQLFGVRIA
ncbi:MAG: hypothetical protein U0872_13195 [Planctomycetaceae bacterium]